MVIVEQGIVMPDAAYRLIRVGSGMGKHGRRMAIVDIGDWSELWWRSWSLRRADAGNYYAATTYQGRTVEMHRIITGVFDPAIYVDHLDGRGLNNRRYNLKPGPPKDNVDTRQQWRIEGNRHSGQWWVIVTAANGSEVRLGPYGSYSEAHHERYSKSDYWNEWER